MISKLKIYTDLALLKEGSPVEMLMPFIDMATETIESEMIENGRFNDYVKTGSDFIELTSIHECNACLLPVYYDLSNKRPIFEEKIAAFLKEAEYYNKKIIIFAGHDVTNVNINFKNSIVFNSAISKSDQANNEESWPHFFEDFLAKYHNGNLPIRSKRDKPVLGFCGYAPPLNITLSKEKVISTLKLIANYAGVLQKYPGKVSHSYRARAILGLQKSKKVTLNFRLKSNFAFGPRGLNSGNTSESNADFRKNFVDNIIDSDYTLCVRGIGNNSIRFFETICCGRIPVFVNTDSVLPFDRFIEWKKLCVWVEEKDIDHIDDIVAEFHKNISEEDFISLQKKLRAIWEEYFSPTGFFKSIAHFIDS